MPHDSAAEVIGEGLVEEERLGGTMYTVSFDVSRFASFSCHSTYLPLYKYI